MRRRRIRRRETEPEVEESTRRVPAAKRQAAPMGASNRASFSGGTKGHPAAPEVVGGPPPSASIDDEVVAELAVAEVSEEPAAAGAFEGMGVVIEGEAAGHGGGGNPTTPTAVAPGSAGAASPTGVDVTVNYVVNEPVERRRPGAEIAAEHGQADAMGWTTPSYSINGRPGATTQRGTVDVTVDSEIELADEYTGRTLDVLREHEMGHANVAKYVGRQFLAEPLETDLESLPALTPAATLQEFAKAGARFEFWEGTLSWMYDLFDYPRMRAAYEGARMTLDELTDASPATNDLVAALRRFSSVGRLPGDVEAAARQVISKTGDLTILELARVQYNEEFEDLVGSADETIIDVMGEFADSSPAETQLRELLDTLGAFSWEPPGDD